MYTINEAFNLVFRINFEMYITDRNATIVPV